MSSPVIILYLVDFVTLSLLFVIHRVQKNFGPNDKTQHEIAVVDIT